MTGLDFGQSSLPWFLPALAVSFVVSVAGGERLGRALSVRPAIGCLILLSFGLILSATLTPQREALEFGVVGASSCNFARISPAEVSTYLMPGEIAGNVLMFIPLGTSIALVPRSRGELALVAVSFALPVVIEAAQLLVSALDRACESGDVVDNLIGLTLGLAIVAATGFTRGPRGA